MKNLYADKSRSRGKLNFSLFTLYFSFKMLKSYLNVSF